MWHFGDSGVSDASSTMMIIAFYIDLKVFLIVFCFFVCFVNLFKMVMNNEMFLKLLMIKK